MPDDSLATIATALYAELPGDFVAVRDARAKSLRAEGRRDLAVEVKALRRPTTAAWLVNLLAQVGGSLDPLTDLGHQLREAQSQLNAPAMKELTGRRPAVIGELVAEAVRLAGERDPAFQDSAATREQVTATLTAALADPRAEDAVASGRLVTALAYAGFGEVEIGDAVATPLRAVPDHPVPRRPASERVEASPEPEPQAVPTEPDLEAARARVSETAAALEVAEASLAQARARRAAARRAWEAATAALEDLEDA